MITTSQAWKEYSRDVGLFHVNALLDNGTKLHLYDEDFMQGSVSITDSISGMSDFTVGAVITNTFNGTLNNFSGKFNSYNLASATLAVRFGVTFQESEQPTRVEEGLVSSLDGQEYNVDGQIRTPFIPVESGTSYRINYDYDHDFVLVEYNADKEFISGVEVMGNADYTFTPSSGTAYIRISFGDYGDVFKYDFHIYDGADILWGDDAEWIDRGTYTLEKPTSLGSTIKVVGYDDMDKLNRYYIGKDADNNDITFPIYANTLATKLCEYCGVTFGSWGLAGGTIDEFEYDESTTCRQVLSWIVQSFGGYARINPQGSLDCKQFNANVWDVGDEVQGGVINPWGGAGTVSGGSMNPWSAVTGYDGGENGNIDFTLSKIKSLNVYVEDIAVTGVRAYAYNTVDEFQFNTVGTDGYILAIQDNPLVTDNTLAVATRVYNATKDLKFRPFDASIIGDPSIEAGDIIALQDYLGNAHVSLITSLTYSVNSAERLECNAKTPEEADLETANPQTSVIKGATMAAYDYITAKKISADYISAGTLGVNGKITAEDLEITGGEVGNFTIVDGKIQTTYVYPHTYTSDDLMTMNSIIASSRTPTQEELELYDVNGDGEITTEDVLIVSDVIDNADGVLSSTITLDPSSYKEMVKVTNCLDETSYMGGSGGNFFKLLLDSVEIKDTVVDRFYYNPTNPNLAWFKAFGIELKSGLKMVGGYVDLGSVAMTSQYGNAYYKSVTVNFPIYIFDSTIFSINVSALATTGLISVSVNNVSTAGFSAYVFDAQSETIHVYLQYFIIGI